MRPAASSSRNAFLSAATARAASASGRVKPIELSDEAWKIVETERPSAWTGSNVRAAMPGTPTMPFPATVTRAWPADGGERLHGVAGQRASRLETSVPGRVGVHERADVEDDAAAVERDERARVQHLGAEVGDLGGLAVVELRDEARVGDGLAGRR